MKKNEMQIATESPGLVLVASYVLLFIVNAIVIYFANKFFPMQVVLGTMSLTAFWAIFHTANIVSLIGAFAIPFVHHFERSRQKMFSSTEWMVTYFVLNFIAIWLVTRYSDQFGMGVSSWMVVAGLALALDMVQGIAMMQLESMRLKMSQ